MKELALLILFISVLHSPMGGYLYTPIGFSLDKNALTTATHPGNILLHFGLIRHSGSPPALGSTGPRSLTGSVPCRILTNRVAHGSQRCRTGEEVADTC
jgi:hypothetical protein